MKNYIWIVAIASFFVGAHSYSAVKYDIVPTGTGPDAIVDAIRQYSNITEADVNKYKLLWLGWFGAVPTLAIGSYSSYKGYEGAGMAFDYVSNKIGLKPIESKLFDRQRMPTIDEVQSSAGMVSDFLKTRTPWMAAGAILAGLVSYKFFYPRIRQGVLNKVQNFLDMCAKLTVAQKQVFYISEIPEWSITEDIAVCRAFNNLEEQARFAGSLLGHVGLTDAVVDAMNQQLNNYYVYLRKNKNHWNAYCNGLVRAETEQEVSGVLLEGAKLQNRANWWSMAKNAWKLGKDVVTTGKDVVGWMIENKGSITSALGTGWLVKWYLGK